MVQTLQATPTKKEEGGKIPAVLGSGVTVTRHALDVKFEVRILAPQPITNCPHFGDNWFNINLSNVLPGYGVLGKV